MTTDDEGGQRMHLIVDGTARNIALMTDKDRMSRYLKDLVKACGMSPFGEPIVVGYPWPGSQDQDAISAVCFLKESAVMVHCYPEQYFVFVDVFSCRDFKYGKIYGHIKRAFDMDQARTVLLDRGIDETTGACIPASVRRQRKAKVHG